MSVGMAGALRGLDIPQSPVHGHAIAWLGAIRKNLIKMASSAYVPSASSY